MDATCIFFQNAGVTDYAGEVAKVTSWDAHKHAQVQRHIY